MILFACFFLLSISYNHLFIRSLIRNVKWLYDCDCYYDYPDWLKSHDSYFYTTQPQTRAHMFIPIIFSPFHSSYFSWAKYSVPSFWDFCFHMKAITRRQRQASVIFLRTASPKANECLKTSEVDLNITFSTLLYVILSIFWENKCV